MTLNNKDICMATIFQHINKYIESSHRKGFCGIQTQTQQVVKTSHQSSSVLWNSSKRYKLILNNMFYSFDINSQLQFINIAVQSTCISISGLNEHGLTSKYLYYTATRTRTVSSVVYYAGRMVTLQKYTNNMYKKKSYYINIKRCI